MENDKDFVRIEISSAMRQRKRVMPVLVNNARYLRESDLPDELKPLARRHAARLTHERFRSDVGSLISAVRRALQEADKARLAEAEADLDAETKPRASSAKSYKRAYLSFAAADRVDVLRRAQVLKMAGIDFTGDFLSLEPGERWESKLVEQIKTADLFLLFWSRAAAASEWVMREARLAVAAREESAAGLPDIVPVVLEWPPPAPPAFLSDLHFSEPLHYLIDIAKPS